MRVSGSGAGTTVAPRQGAGPSTGWNGASILTLRSSAERCHSLFRLARADEQSVPAMPWVRQRKDHSSNRNDRSSANFARRRRNGRRADALANNVNHLNSEVDRVRSWQRRLDHAGVAVSILCAIRLATPLIFSFLRAAGRDRQSSVLVLLMVSFVMCGATTTTASAQSPGVAPASAVVVEVVRAFIGFPYRLGGDSPKGLDCSALVQRTFRAVGLELPRTAAKQFRQGCAVAREGLMAGDLVFFRGRRPREISHVGIYIGGGHFVHAARHGVVVASLRAGHWSRRFAGARRLIEAAPPVTIDDDFCIEVSEHK